MDHGHMHAKVHAHASGHHGGPNSRMDVRPELAPLRRRDPPLRRRPCSRAHRVPRRTVPHHGNMLALTAPCGIIAAAGQGIATVRAAFARLYASWSRSMPMSPRLAMLHAHALTDLWAQQPAAFPSAGAPVGNDARRLGAGHRHRAARAGGSLARGLLGPWGVVWPGASGRRPAVFSHPAKHA
eukprot:364247-Chlamydomonas_euryale.AAC.27